MVLSAPVFAATHKIQVSDPAIAREIVAAGGCLLVDYGHFQLYEIEQVSTDISNKSGAEIRDEYNRIELNAATINTTETTAKTSQKTAGAFFGKRLHLVQFIGPVQPAWREELIKAGVRVVTYIPNNTYLVYGDTKAVAQLQELAATASNVQWNGEYANDYKIHPRARTVDENGNVRTIGTGVFMIQLVADAEPNAATLQLIDRLKLEPIQRQYDGLGYHNIQVRLAPDSLQRIAAQPDVVSIQPYFEPKKFCERQDQIVAGNISGNAPTGTGYLAWLASKGFAQAQFDASGFVVDLSDSGIDNGTTAPNHFGLYIGGDINSDSRVAYNRLVGAKNEGSTLQGCDGHGNLNAHIVAGYNDLTSSPHVDTNGYHYGLGVCPFVKVGSSVVFDPDTWTYPDFNDLMSQAYHDSARISNNSWGSSDYGYDSYAQSYDALVRDAQPTGSTYSVTGNQEMVIVFAAGNDGPSTQTVCSPGTAKNVITIGAAENVQAFGGADGSGVYDTDANSANDMTDFSGRGPCSDGRNKPDIVAPGTHISGGVPQAASPSATGTALACYDGSGVSGGVSNIFYPSGQEFYTASSGTSHSTPCVAGGCALLRQYFINYFGNPPSPAMTKAYLMNSARYMTGTNANDTLWSNKQGMGEMNLGMALDGASRVLRDELDADLLTASGQTRTFTGTIDDSSKPFRVTLAWTDAPGSTTANAYNNNLDLTATAGGNTYKGNVFSSAYSTTGGTADSKNNVESVFLAAGVSGIFTVVVTAVDINSDGVPNNTNSLDQDFALVIYNATTNYPPVITSPPTITNALLQVTNVAVVVSGDTNVFVVGAVDYSGDTLDYQWSFGDGTNSGWHATNTASHVYTTNCGPYTASVTVSDGHTTVTSNLTVAIACEPTITRMHVKLNFSKANADSASLNATLDLGAGFSVTNKVVAVDIGGTTNATFTLNARGRGVGAFGSCKLAYNKKTGLWTLKVRLKNGSWQAAWATYGLQNTTVTKTGLSVTMPVVILTGDEGFAVERQMCYTARTGRSGSAK